MNRFFTLLLAASCLTAVGQDFDGLTQAFTTDSSIFLTSEGQLSWDNAQAFAASVGGHLATFANAAENQEIVPWMTQNSGYWFGLRQDVNGAEPDEGWGWVTGESLDFTNWNDPEPNNVGNEDCGELTANGTWNDNACVELRYFVVEVALHAGCTDQMACNYDPEANVDDGSCELSGCLDDEACNFNAEAACEDGSCDYSCCPGPGCCTEGMYWDWELSGCYNINPADINFDGCVQLNDLLDLLSAYGNCSAEESPWQCGDPLEYQGYDYQTVQIGEQCWFAENLRAENYTDGSSIPLHSIGNPVSGPDPNYRCFYDDDPYNSVENGMLYSWYASTDSRGICPSGWHLPSLTDFEDLTNVVGGASNAGSVLKVQPPTWNGSDEYGFTALPSGYFNWVNAPYSSDPLYFFMGSYAYFWSSVSSGSNSAYYMILWNDEDYASLLPSNGNFAEDAMSVRCIKDTE